MENNNNSSSKFSFKALCSSCCTLDDVDVQKVHVSLSTWLPEIKDRCASIFSGKAARNRHRGNTAEFRYDPLSYALNFEDDDARVDEFPLRNFSSRLPPSPEKKCSCVVVVNREIAAWS